MVVVGTFSAKLVNAETNKPFQEHLGKRGEVYAEVEPDCEYFIQVEVLGGSMKKKRCFQVAIDLDQSTHHQLLESRTITNRKSGPALIGMLSRENGRMVNKAFALHNPGVKYNADLKVDTCAPIGSVTVQISKAVYDGCHEPTEFKARIIPAKKHLEVPYEYGVFSGKKFLRSTEGTLCTSPLISSTKRSSSSQVVTPEKPLAKRRKMVMQNAPSYRPGTLLQEINIHYCTALGLIHAGVLDKPPMWDLFRKQQAYGKQSLNLPRPNPTKRIKVDAVYDGTTLIKSEKWIEVFDLTTTNTISDSDTSTSSNKDKESGYMTHSCESNNSNNLRSEGNDGSVSKDASIGSSHINDSTKPSSNVGTSGSSSHSGEPNEKEECSQEEAESISNDAFIGVTATSTSSSKDKSGSSYHSCEPGENEACSSSEDRTGPSSRSCQSGEDETCSQEEEGSTLKDASIGVTAARTTSSIKEDNPGSSSHSCDPNNTDESRITDHDDASASNSKDASSIGSQFELALLCQDGMFLESQN